MKKKNNRSKFIIRGIIPFIIAASLYNFVWNEFVVNPTAQDVLEKEDGKQIVLQNIDDKRTLGIMKIQNGYYAYALSDGFWGWTVTDKVYLPKATNKEKVSAIHDTLIFKRNKELDVILISSLNNKISYFEAYDGAGKEVIFDTNRERKYELHYGYSEESLPNELTIDGYSSDDKVLYRE
ncbi:MAG TPA: hypothetical protein VK072_01020 [Candidatus Avamphibacillus sp.]|nr:hypothetical protein [Candidatus Avamphibacillus sp.]